MDGLLWTLIKLFFSSDCRDHEDMDVDLDREFLLGLRELKFLTDKDHLDEHRT